jgi:uncharacterized protein
VAEGRRLVPTPTPETQHVWDALRDEGTLLLQRCAACSHIWFPPRPFCPACTSREVEPLASRGRGTLYSYVISHRAAPGFDAPYVIAVVELAEGPRLMTNLVDVEPDPEALALDVAVELVPTAISDEITLPLFRPVATTEAGAAGVGAAEVAGADR